MLKDPVKFSDFAKIDFRVGKVLKVEKVKESEKLIRMKIDLGVDYGIRTIFAGIASLYKPSQLKNKKFIIVANLESKKMLGEESQGMMLAVDTEGTCLLLPVHKDVLQGSVVR